MEFQTHTIFTREASDALLYLSEKTINSKKKRLRRVACLALGILGLGSGYYLFVTYPDKSLYSQLSFAYGTVFLLIGLLWRPFMSRASSRLRSWEKMDRIFRFYDEGFSAGASATPTHYDYAQIIAISESEHWIALFFDQKSAYILDKRNFTTGDLHDFGPFLEEKTGLTIARA